MRIALNAQLISTGAGYRAAGVSRYSQYLTQSLGRLGLPHHLEAYVRDPAFQAPGVELVRTRWPTHRPLARILWEQALLPRMLAARGVELVHGLVNVLPLATKVPGVVTVHDLSFLHLPGALPRAKRLYLRALCRASVRRARAVIAVSRQTGQDVVRSFSVSARRVHVVYNGVDDRFRPPDPAQAAAFRRARGLPERYVLYLGTLEPRKNLERLLQAFALWRSRHPGQEDVVLVLAGARGWFYESVFRRSESLGLTRVVRFPGYLPPEELPLWYGAATVFVYPSLFEGFGLPVLEAMACGTPVLCSDTASLGEVVGDAAWKVPPEDTEALAQGLAGLLSDPGLRTQLAGRGLARARRFSWQRTAQETAAVYEAVVRSVSDRHP